MSHDAGMIVMWSESIGSIPAGWALCDGNNGTPDLRDRFIVGAGTTYNPDDTGGDANHTHGFTSDPHMHDIAGGTDIDIGAGSKDQTSNAVASGTTNNTNALPPYYSLAYIMRL